MLRPGRSVTQFCGWAQGCSSEGQLPQYSCSFPGKLCVPVVTWDLWWCCIQHPPYVPFLASQLCPNRLMMSFDAIFIPFFFLVHDPGLGWAFQKQQLEIRHLSPADICWSLAVLKNGALGMNLCKPHQVRAFPISEEHGTCLTIYDYYLQWNLVYDWTVFIPRESTCGKAMSHQFKQSSLNVFILWSSCFPCASNPF